jgi:hypothetical protein|tara:strand:+ start:585 stop:1163 length:579 start_codon:yes stop_codon:yes gene_type:complete
MSLETKNLERYLKSFGKQVVKESKGLLKDAKGSTALGNSIRVEVVKTDTGFDTMFYMQDYGTYLDKGVSGNEEQQSYKDYKGITRVSDYKYTTRMPPPSLLEKWIKKKGLKGRKSLIKNRKKENKSKKIKGAGQFITAQSFAFAIAKSIQKKGIKSLSFFQKPLGEGIKRLNNNILKEIKLDIQQYLVTFTK